MMDFEEVEKVLQIESGSIGERIVLKEKNWKERLKK